MTPWTKEAKIQGSFKKDVTTSTMLPLMQYCLHISLYSTHAMYFFVVPMPLIFSRRSFHGFGKGS
jgi:ABC-type sulfate transport system permease component